MATDVRQIIIIGGGIIGCTTAYYLTRHPAFDPTKVAITLIEASTNGVAQGASGKAGGLVAKWAYPPELVHLSWDEHVKLATEHGGAERWGWRYVSAGSWHGRGEFGGSPAVERKQAKSTEPRSGLPEELCWVKEHLTDAYSPMAPDGETAQVHPYLFTTSMLALAQANGVEFKAGSVKSIEQSEGKVTGVLYTPLGESTTQTLAATDAILCAGPWSANLVPDLSMEGTRTHSVVIRPQPSAIISPHVLFTEIKGEGRSLATPEIYPRPDGTVYASGGGDDSELPATVDGVKIDPLASVTLLRNVRSISNELAQGTVETRQACYLPISNAGPGPIVGLAPSVASGLVVATAHNCWGITNAPGTGKVVAELIFEGAIKSADLKKLDPVRYMGKYDYDD